MLTEKNQKSFIGRDHELTQLYSLLVREKASLVVIYGRRRIGKTRLLNEFCRGKSALRFEGLEKGNTPAQLNHFLAQLASQTGREIFKKVRCDSWQEAFDLLTREMGQKKLILVFDEFPWMIEKNPEHVSLLKYYWDSEWSSRNLMLILCGSVNTFMVRELIFSSALYGRINQEIHLKPFSVDEVHDFWGRQKSAKEVIDFYMVFGGIPRYLEEINPRRSVIQNIDDLCFTKDAFFVREFERLFHDEFGKFLTYSRLAGLLAKNNSLNYTEIIRGLRAEMGGGYKDYLDHLEKADFIESFVPFQKSRDSRLVRYRLVDEYLLFYFYFIEPRLSLISHNQGEKTFLNLVGKQSWSSWAGFAFEKFCLKHAAKIQKILKIDQLVKNYGSYFSRKTTRQNGFQIDLVFDRHDQVVTLCEIKYTSRPVGLEVIDSMEKKTGFFPLKRNQSIDRVLIASVPPQRSLVEQNYFNRIVLVDDLVG